jgi:hypothetical protein
VIGGDLLRRAEDAPADHRAERVEHPRGEADAAENRERVAEIFRLAAEENDRGHGNQEAPALDEIEPLLKPEIRDARW